MQEFTRKESYRTWDICISSSPSLIEKTKIEGAKAINILKQLCNYCTFVNETEKKNHNEGLDQGSHLGEICAFRN